MLKKPLFEKNVLMLFGILSAIALLVLLVKVIIAPKACPDIKITVSNSSPTENTPVTVNFVNHDVKTWDWDFGDSTPHANTATANHTYKASGQYKLTLTVNGKCSDFVGIIVGTDLNKKKEGLPEPVIEGPDVAEVDVPVKFKETSGLGTSWEWKFQESGAVDSKAQAPSYTFKSPGKKIIEVTINGPGKSAVGYLTVDVKPAGSGGGGGGAGAGSINEQKVIAMLNDIAARKRDASIFAPYVCGDLRIPVNVNGKQVSFDSYCSKLHSSNSLTEIENLVLMKDPAKNCIKTMVIHQHGGKWSPFRKK